MIFETVAGIVGRTDQSSISLFHQSPAGIARLAKPLPAFLPDAFGGIGIQQAIVDAEKQFQFQMHPMVKRTAQEPGNRLRPLQELLPVRSVPGNETFVDTIGAHGPPGIMVMGQPDPGQVFESCVFRNVPRREVGVKIIQRGKLGIGSVERASRFAFQQKIVR